MMNKFKRFIPLVLSALILCCSCARTPKTKKETIVNRGNAVVLDGKTVVVSIFATDYLSEWDFTDENDIKTREQISSDLKIALDYLTDESRKWGKNAEFIYDWEENPDLYAERSVPTEGVYFHYESQYRLSVIITRTFNINEILEKYSADNVIFLYHFNTPPDDEEEPLTAQAFPNYESSFNVEFSAFPLYSGGDRITPSIYAHEILHLFGALDYYISLNFEQAVTPEYVEYCAENHSNEIMFESWCYDDEITLDISEATAYYVGWTDHSEDVEQFGLPLSQHSQAKQS